jgi:signal peptidase I
MIRRRRQISFYQKKKKNKSRIFREIFSFLGITVFAVFLAFLLVMAFGMQTKVIGDSMEPTIYNGQGVLVNRAFIKIFSPKTGDIIVFLPNGNVNSHYYVKRIVAGPGDTVQITDGVLYVNGSIVEEDDDQYDKMEDAGIAANPVKLSSGEYFVLGDNRNSSEDSRSANIGVVKQSMMIGKVWFKLRSENGSAGIIINNY